MQVAMDAQAVAVIDVDVPVAPPVDSQMEVDRQERGTKRTADEEITQDPQKKTKIGTWTSILLTVLLKQCRATTGPAQEV